ncbi:hypothetical protein [Nakamurella lactea]|uniref:hypothetical protein n=1 Tax=Nakamurella lactea TaxID=459515 RepID=UPI00042A1B1D|nr:hypothetical protein [Nakamurella lactea]
MNTVVSVVLIIAGLNLLLVAVLLVGFIRRPFSKRNTIGHALQHVDDPVDFYPAEFVEVDWEQLVFHNADFDDECDNLYGSES